MSDPPSDLPNFVLASGSPRRAELLERLGVPFDVVAADIDESRRDGEPAADLVARVASEKAAVIAGSRPGEIVVAADTMVVVDGEPLGKPHDPDVAIAMLERLVGRSHEVLTGVCVIAADGSTRSIVESATVTVAGVPPDELEWYVSTGEALDKAGAYALQGVGAFLIESVTGDPTTIIGLPLGPTIELLRRAGLDWP